MSVELVILTGLQAAGKTTFYRERFAATHVHISKDAWPNARKKEARQRRLATRRRSFDGLDPSRYSSRIHRTSPVKTSAAG
jgi:hypothetical protein